MNTANILEPHTIAAQAPTTRAAELYPLVLTPCIQLRVGNSPLNLHTPYAKSG